MQLLQTQLMPLRCSGILANSAAGTCVLMHQQPCGELTSQRLFCWHRGHWPSTFSFLLINIHLLVCGAISHNTFILGIKKRPLGRFFLHDIQFT